MKTCKDCLLDKPLNDFYKDTRYTKGVKSQCKKCYHESRIESSKSYRKDNKDKLAINMKSWRENNKEHVEKYRIENKRTVKTNGKYWAGWPSHKNTDKRKDYNLRYQYGITLDIFNNMKKEQSNKCKICQKEFGETRYTGPCVDHCHITGHVRGLLCHKCNLLVGQYELYGPKIVGYLAPS